MAETVGEVIGSALQEILVQASEAPIDAADAQTAIKYLNRLMTRWDAQGLSLGYSIVSSLSDYVTIPDGAIDGVVKNLAISLHSQYSSPGTPIPVSLIQEAREGLDAIRDITVDVGPSLYPDTLPVGSGNEDVDTYVFYTDPDDPILSETGGFIATEEDTEL